MTLFDDDVNPQTDEGRYFFFQDLLPVENVFTVQTAKGYDARVQSTHNQQQEQKGTEKSSKRESGESSTSASEQLRIRPGLRFIFMCVKLRASDRVR